MGAWVPDDKIQSVLPILREGCGDEAAMVGRFAAASVLFVTESGGEERLRKLAKGLRRPGLEHIEAALQNEIDRVLLMVSPGISKRVTVAVRPSPDASSLLASAPLRGLSALGNIAGKW